MIENNNYNHRFWKVRSKFYDCLEWARHSIYLDEFVKLGNFKKSDIVLDVGTGTGIVGTAVAPLVRKVIGLDISREMLKNNKSVENIYFIQGNILDPIFKDDVFDKITCRQVFHHILRHRDVAMKICHRLLKRGGVMIFSEGVPPTERVKKDYIEIFRLKERRAVFYEEDLMDLMKLGGFKNVKLKIVYLKKMSVRNWLKNSGLTTPIQEKIYRLHKYAPDYFKHDYNMFEVGRDCLIDMKMAILVGKK